MPHQPISSPRHVLHLAKASLLLLLLSPNHAGALNQCEDRLKQEWLPANTHQVLEPSTLAMNGQQFCVLAFQTPMAPEPLAARYREFFNAQSGTLVEDQNIANSSAQSLLFIGPDGTEHLEILPGEPDGSAVTLSVMSMDAPLARHPEPQAFGPSDFVIIHDQHTENGRTLMVEALSSGDTLRAQIIRYFQHLGWSLQSNIGQASDSQSSHLAQDGQTLTITTGVEGNEHIALLQFLGLSQTR